MMARMTKSPKASKRIRSGKKLSRSTRKAALRKAMLENDKKTKSKEDGKEKKKAKPQEAKQSNFEKEVREKVDKALRMAREGMEVVRRQAAEKYEEIKPKVLIKVNEFSLKAADIKTKTSALMESARGEYTKLRDNEREKARIYSAAAIMLLLIIAPLLMSVAPMTANYNPMLDAIPTWEGECWSEGRLERSDI